MDSERQFRDISLHYDNIYTQNENSLSIPVINTDKFIGIARGQSSKWSPSTILSQDHPNGVSNDGSIDLSRDEPNLDIDSTHIISTPTSQYDFDITKSSKLHQHHHDYVDNTADDQIDQAGQTSAMSDDKDNETDSSQPQQPTQSSIDIVNDHPIFNLLSTQDTQYIQSIMLQLASHQSTIDYPMLNPYQQAQTMAIKYDTSQLLGVLNQTSPNPFPKSLSLFQSHGIAALLHNHHLLVTAHTGSGKTIAAHALILNTLAKGGKIVYTTPIKALSNQKFAELSRIYPDVGLQTGDVTVNPDATIVVMTTEILRNLSIHIDSPYAAAIFDEVHYMEDMSRGVIWEETLLTLPSTTQMVFLSASVENGDEFAKWIAQITKRPCHIVNTRVRAVPIAHLILQQTQPTTHAKPLDIQREYEANYRSRNDQRSKNDHKSTNIRPILNPFPISTYMHHLDLPAPDPQTPTDIPSAPSHIIFPQLVSAVLTAIKNHWLPLISFSFARKDLDFYAERLLSLGFCVTTPSQQEQIRTFCEDNFEQDTPKRDQLIEQLSMGIGVHHSGQISRVREVVEFLLEKSLLKILFATETFAVGINVPVRTVMFTALSKFDGFKHRLISPSEYTQMSGRAGRRGMDRVGISIVLEDRTITPAIYRSVVCGASLCLESRFRVSIGLLLSSFASNRSQEKSIVSTRKSLDVGLESQNAVGNAVKGLLEMEHGGGYTLQQVIQNSFAIFRFTNNKSAIITAMLTRSLLLFAQLVFKLFHSANKANQMGKLDRFLPWINIPEVYAEIGSNVMLEISRLNISSFNILSFVLNDDNGLVINTTINIGKLASVLISPPLLYPLYLQSLYLLTTQGLISTINNPTTFFEHSNRSNVLFETKPNNLLRFSEIYSTIFSILDPLTNETIGFQPFSHYISQYRHEFLTHQLTTLSTLSVPSQTPPLHTFNTPLDQLYTRSKSTDPNDVINYCIPGRVVYIEFPQGFHDENHLKSSAILDVLLNGRANGAFSADLTVPQCIGWGVVLNTQAQYNNSNTVDVLCALPVMASQSVGKGAVKKVKSYELHVLSLCECSISRVSSMVIQMPQRIDLDSEPGLFAVWHSLRVAAATWGNHQKIDTNNDKYFVQNGLDRCGDINDLIGLVGDMNNDIILQTYKMTSFPLLYSRNISQSGHMDAFHRNICTLLELPKKLFENNNNNNNNNDANLQKKEPKKDENISDSFYYSPFQYSQNYLLTLLTGVLESYPPPLRLIINLLLDTQALWLGNKLDSFKHTLQLASSSYNNPASTETDSVQVDDTIGDVADINDQNEKKLQQISQLEDKKKLSIQSIVAKYLSTVTTMTKYMLQKGYIVPHDQSTYGGDSTDYVQALMAARTNTTNVTSLLSNFKTQAKGTVCSFIDNPNSVIITELLFDNALNDLTIPELAAVCSIFITSASASDQSASSSLYPDNIIQMHKRIVKECADLAQLTENVDKINNDDDGNNNNNNNGNHNNNPTNEQIGPTDDEKLQNKLNRDKKNTETLAALKVSPSLLYDTREIGLQMVLPVLKWCETHNIEQSLEAAPGDGTLFPGNLSRALHRLLNLFAQIERGLETIGDETLLKKIRQTVEVVQSGTLFQSSLHLLEMQKQLGRI
jgi:superfamily II RNA helicase